MRADIVDILQYLPSFLSKDKLFRATNDADSAEHDSIRVNLQDLLDQLCVLTATWGIEKWEELVDVTPQRETDIESRRAAVLLKLKKPPSVTVTFLENLINQYIADKSGTVADHPETYSTDFNVPLLDKENMAGMTRDVRIYIPAHIGPVYKAHTLTGVENHVAMLKSTVKTVDVYPAAVEQIKPESTFYVALAMTTTEELTLQIGGI
ncbi:MAG: putative phage tail protein [Selenomonadaceae bacterium]|nr:putative phage tail protein [Selenomonadaceae bacterium]